MTTQEVLEHYGSVANTAKALGCWPTSLYKWKEHPPKAIQFQLQVITDGELKVEEELLNARND